MLYSVFERRVQRRMPRKMKRVYIEITNVCNLHCDFCPKTKRRYAFMTVNKFRHIIKEIHPYTKMIYLHILGEPLLNPNLSEMLQIADDYNIRVNITTNGTLLMKEVDVLIHASALRQINLSLHSLEANIGSMKPSVYIKQVADAIRHIHAERQIYFSLRLWNMDNLRLTLRGKNQKNEEILAELQEALQTEQDLTDFLMHPKQTSIQLKEQIYLHKAEKFQWPSMENKIFLERMFCYGLRDHFGILVDGTVVPCCLDGEGQMSLGNIFEMSIEEILQSERAKKIYDGFSRRCAVEDLCKRCGYAERF